MKTLQQVMSPTDICFDPDDKLIKVVESLADHRRSCALICDSGKPVGILTERDIVRLLTVHKENPAALLQDTPIQEVMTLNPEIFPCDLTLTDAINKARGCGFRRFPVVKPDGCLVGVVTYSDMIGVYLELTDSYQDLEVTNQQLQSLSLEDSLTMLPNRRAMEKELDHSVAASRRSGESFSVAMLDLDYFKKYNDQFGHDAGDKALQHVAEIFRTMVRGSERVYRYGGEEFLYLMPDTQLRGAKVAAERLRRAIADSEFEQGEKKYGHLTVSAGVATYKSGNWLELVKQADRALYVAKRQGRNRVESTVE